MEKDVEKQSFHMKHVLRLRTNFQPMYSCIPREWAMFNWAARGYDVFDK